MDIPPDTDLVESVPTEVLPVAPDETVATENTSADDTVDVDPQDGGDPAPVDTSVLESDDQQEDGPPAGLASRQQPSRGCKHIPRSGWALFSATAEDGEDSAITPSPSVVHRKNAASIDPVCSYSFLENVKLCEWDTFY